MRRTPLVALAAASLLATGLTAASSASADETRGEKRVCAHAPTGYAACDAHVRTKGAVPDATTTPSATAYGPNDLVSAYKLPSSTTTAKVAIVDAYDNPNAAGDLAAYRSNYGLSPASLTRVNQDGNAPSAAADTGWGQEEMLDLEMVSAVCPSCQILYVGASSASFSDLAAAVNTAARLGATVISNSYGGSEFSTETQLASSYNKPGIAITVSSGDNGYGVEVPAAFGTVTAVGGTSLTKATNARGWSETAWSGAGSGCSAYIAKPSWQKDTACGRRSVADVSAVADPNTGVAVYDSYGSTGGANWYVFGGTSVAAPIIGAVYALSGNTAGVPASIAYANPGGLFDVTSGSNGRCVKGRNSAGGYLCTAGGSYDGPTGLGTPNGLSAF